MVFHLRLSVIIFQLAAYMLILHLHSTLHVYWMRFYLVFKFVVVIVDFYVSVKIDA